MWWGRWTFIQTDRWTYRQIPYVALKLGGFAEVNSFILFRSLCLVIFRQQPQTGQSPVKHRGTFVYPSVIPSVHPPLSLFDQKSVISGQTSALSSLKSALYDLKSAFSGLKFAL